MSKGFMLIDESNWGFAASSSKPLNVGEQDTNAIFYFLRRLRECVAAYPTLTPIALADGFSWRYQAFPAYKGSRDKSTPTTSAEIKQAKLRSSYKSQKPLITKAMSLLGVRRMYALNMEADDLAGIMVRRYAGAKHVLLMSGDKDWIQLVGPGVTWIDLINKRRISDKSFAERNASTESVGIGFDRAGEWIGLSKPYQWTDVKALQGDTSDEIGGVGGIGEKGAVELVRQYGSVNNFFNGVLDKSIDLDKLPKKLRDLATSDEKAAIYRRNMTLMNLHEPTIPKPTGLTMSSGKLDKEGFAEFCREWLFQSILIDFDSWIEPFEGMTA